MKKEGKMSAQTISLSAEKRSIVGKKVSALRKQGKIPAVVHERGEASIHIVADLIPLTKVWHQAGGNHVVSLSLDNQNKLVMFKDVTLDPVKGTVNHVAFHAIKQNESVEAEVPVVIVGDVPAERKGLFLVRPLDTVTVKALPGDLPESFELDGSTLEEAGDNLKVEDIKPSGKVEILTEADRPVVIVEEPRSAVEAEAEATEAAAEVPSEHGGEESTVAE